MPLQKLKARLGFGPDADSSSRNLLETLSSLASSRLVFVLIGVLLITTCSLSFESALHQEHQNAYKLVPPRGRIITPGQDSRNALETYRNNLRSTLSTSETPESSNDVNNEKSPVDNHINVVRAVEPLQPGFVSLDFEVPSVNHHHYDMKAHFLTMPSDKPTRRLVLALFDRLDETAFSTFGKSLRSALGDDAEIAVFVPFMYENGFKEMPNKFGTHFIVYDRSQIGPTSIQELDSSVLRWILFSQLLNEYNSFIMKRYDFVMICDIDSVSFYKDPFTILHELRSIEMSRVSMIPDVNLPLDNLEGSANGEGELENGSSSGDLNEIDLSKESVSGATNAKLSLVGVFAETAVSNVGSITALTDRIHVCFGESLSGLIGMMPLISQNIVIGSVSEIITIVDLYERIILGYSSLGQDSFPRCAREETDRAVFNVIVHASSLKHIVTYTDNGFEDYINNNMWFHFDKVMAKIPVVVNTIDSILPSEAMAFDNNLNNINNNDFMNGIPQFRMDPNILPRMHNDASAISPLAPDILKELSLMTRHTKVLST